MENISIVPSSYSTTVYDTNNKQIAKLITSGSNRIKADLKDIPEHLRWAFIDTEDARFYEHNGIDVKGILRAGMKALTTGDFSEGASTITQQLARNIFLGYEKTYSRKIKEMFIAVALEQKYTKQEILEFYLNNVYFANGYYGIESASEAYFNKNAKDLSISQIAFLCSIPNSPNRYDPYKHRTRH